MPGAGERRDVGEVGVGEDRDGRGADGGREVPRPAVVAEHQRAARQRAEQPAERGPADDRLDVAAEPGDHAVDALLLARPAEHDDAGAAVGERAGDGAEPLLGVAAPGVGGARVHGDERRVAAAAAPTRDSREVLVGHRDVRLEPQRRGAPTVATTSSQRSVSCW